MLSVGRTLTATLALTLALATAAGAADHQMHVTEVHPSGQDASQAFVELQPAASESYPALSYTLASLDGSGQVLGQQTFNPPYGFANTTAPYLVGATGVTPRDATLAIPLAAARRVCFYRGAGTSASNLIDCLSFDAVTDGRSAQRTSPGGVVQACPTPDAPNRQTAEPCAGAPAASGPPADVRAPRLTLAAKLIQRVEAVRVSAVVDERSTLTMTGFIRVEGRKRRFVKIVTPSAPGATTRIRAKLTAAGRRAARRALNQGRDVTAEVRVAARDDAGNTTVTTRSVMLRP